MLIPPALLALSPLLLVGVLLVGFRWPAWRAMALGLITTLVITGQWGTPWNIVAAAAIKGLSITLSISWIIFGAVLLLASLRASSLLDSMRAGLTGICPDRRVQAIVVAWLFGGLLEGSAGFGTPAVVCVPLLIAIGFPPLAAVLTGMLIQSAPVSFGALGTPIVIGVATGLGESAEVANWAESANLTFDQLLHNIGWRVASLHAVIGSFMPLLICCLLTGRFGPKRRYIDGLKAWKAALAAGAIFGSCSTATALTLGPEFPTILSAAIGLAILVPLFRAGWFLPKETFDFEHPTHWPSSWVPAETPTPKTEFATDQPKADETSPAPNTTNRKPAAFTWWPYALVVALLVLTRLPALPIGKQLKSDSVSISTGPLFGTDITATIQPLYLPGAIFVLVALAVLTTARRTTRWSTPFREAARTTAKASTVLAFSVPLVQIFLNTGVNPNDLPSMPIAVARGAASLFGQSWPLVSPLVGGFGAFLAGSNTISNMMFALPQFEIARLIEASPQWIVALQAVGGAAGNTICVHNVVAACAVGGLFGREGDVIRVTGIIFIAYATIAGTLGLALT